MLLVISLVLFLASLSGILYFWFRYRDSITEHIQSNETDYFANKETKEVILKNRLKRKLVDRFAFIVDYAKPIFGAVSSFSKSVYDKLREKEREYRVSAEKLIHERKKNKEKNEVINEKLEEVGEIPKDDDETKEQTYLDIISLDPGNIDAYKGLASLYMSRRQFEEAVELYRHIAYLGDKGVECFLEEAKGLSALGRYDEVVTALENALDLEPKNPKIIDRIIEVAILLEDKSYARKFLKRLMDVNPENKKIEDYKMRIDEIK